MSRILDATHLGEDFPDRFPTVFRLATEHGLDPRVDRMPVSPAAHYYMGGVLVDDDGRSNRAGLWAVGEASSTGVHGANRLASNSLLEGLVFGRRVAHDVAASEIELGDTIEIDVPQAALGRRSKADPTVVQGLRDLMWDNVGVERNGADLAAAYERFDEVLSGAGSTRLRNLALVGRLVSEAALLREESRGGHFRTDFPDLDEDFTERRPLSIPAHNGAHLHVRGDEVVDEVLT